MTALITALLHQDLAVLSQPGTISWIYCILILAIFLESALLPAAFLPGDSLLLLAGAMTAKQILPFLPHSGIAGCRYRNRILDKLLIRALAQPHPSGKKMAR